MKIFKYDIRLNTFIKRGLPSIDDRFGVYFVTGKQGSDDDESRELFKFVVEAVTNRKFRTL